MHQSQGQSKDTGLQEVHPAASPVLTAHHEREGDFAAYEPLYPVRGGLWRSQAGPWVPAVFAARKQEGLYGDPAALHGLKPEQAARQNSA